MKCFERIYFLVHGFCYAETARKLNSCAVTPSQARYLAREETCAAQWYSRMRGFSAAEALLIFPFAGDPDGPAEAFNNAAAAALGDRCFVLTGKGYAAGDRGEGTADACLPDPECNREERDMAVHAGACGRQLQTMLVERGYTFDSAAVESEAWGASFDGCVMKFTVNMQRVLGLRNVTGVNFDLTVPDAEFLLDAGEAECVSLDHGLRLYLFRCGRQHAALYTFTNHALGDRAAWMRINVGREQVMVKSKQGLRLWPRPEQYVLKDTPLEYRERPQDVVEFKDGELSVPVSAGYVYRLAKAPAYILAPAGLSYEGFRGILISGRISWKP